MREVVLSRKRTLVVTMAIIALLALAGTSLALPFGLEEPAYVRTTEEPDYVRIAEEPDVTPMVDGPVRAIDQVGTNVWLGGNFSQVKQRSGALIANVDNIAVFDSATGQYRDIAPNLGGTGSEVWDMEPFGGNVLVGGKFPGPSGSQKNLVLLDGTTGQVIRWYNAPALQSVLAAPSLGRVYGGGKALTAFDASTGGKLWTRAATTVDTSIRPRFNTSGYRDLELDGGTIWAACICDTVSNNPSKALVRLDTEGNHDPSWVADADPEAFGISVAQAGETLYLAAGGSDFVAQYQKANGGRRGWIRDTSGSAQAIEVMEGQLVVGGHFWAVADDPDDRCGHRPDGDAATLDPYGECQTRKGLAVYSLGGALDPDWDPVISGGYDLVWALLPGDDGLHFGGDFIEADGATQNHYARLSSSGR